MIESAKQYFAGNARYTPVCIVGAGAVGITVAIKLIRSGISVVLLEAGNNNLVASEAPTPVTNVGDLSTFTSNSFNQGLGGSTLSWGGQILPFDEADFEHRPRIENSGWPINLSDLTPWYQEAEKLLGVDYVEFSNTDLTLAVKTSDVETDLRLGFSKWCPESNFATLFSEELNHSSLMTVVLNASVSEIVDGSKLNGDWECLIEDQQDKYSLHAQIVILAAGGLENYCLLSRSADISSRLPALGHYYHDHIGFYGAQLTPLNFRRFETLFATRLVAGKKCLPKIQVTTHRLLQTSDLNVNGTLEAQPVGPSAVPHLKRLLKILTGGDTIKALPSSIIGVLRGLPETIQSLVNFVVYKRIMLPRRANYFLIANCESAPLFESSISLGDDKPIADWRVDAKSRTALLSFYEQVKEYLEKNEIAEVKIKPSLYENNSNWLDDGYSLYHHMGATRMGSSIETSVVDANCRVHLHERLYVAGCSVLPTGSCSNPTFTAIALGLRLADHLTKQVESPRVDSNFRHDQ